MKFTTLHSNDRIASIFKQAKSMVKQLPLDEMQQQWDRFVKNVTDKMNDTLQDQIEMLTFQLKDNEERLTTLQSLHDNLNLRYEEAKAKLETKWATRSNYSAIAEKGNQHEAEIGKLKEELKIQCQNRDHFRSLVAQQDAFIKDIKAQVEAYKATKQKDSASYKEPCETKTKEAEHLATQAIRLNDENSELIKQNTELKFRNDQLNDQTPRLIEENDAFREQTTRLVEEKRQLQDQICCNTQPPCGGCFSCISAQDGHVINTMDEALIKERAQRKVYKNVADLQQGIIGILYPFVFNLTNNWFPPKGLGYALAAYKASNTQIEFELNALKSIGKAVPPPDLESTFEPCCGPTHACCGDVNNVI